MPPLPVDVGAKVEIVTRDGTTVTGILKELNKPGWIGVLEEATGAIAFVRASEVLVVRQLPIGA